MATKKKKKQKVIDGVVKSAKKKTTTSKKSKATKQSKKPAQITDVKVVETTEIVEEAPSKVEKVEIIEISETPTEPEDLETPAISENPEGSETPIDSEEPEKVSTEPIAEPERIEIAINTPNDDGPENLREIVQDVAEESAEEEVIKEAKEQVEEQPEEKTAIQVEEQEEDSAENIDDNADLEDLINDIEKNTQEEKTVRPKSKRSKTKSDESLTKRKRMPARALPFRIISRLIAIASIGAVTSAIVRITLTGIIPNKYLIPAIAVLALFLLFYLFKVLRKKTHIPVLIILNLIGIALGIVSVFGFVKVQETMSFLFKNFNENKEYTVYNLIVNKESSYSNLEDVKGKTIHSISDFVDTAKLETAAKEQAGATVAYADGISSLLKETYNDKTYIAVLNAGTWDATINLNDGKNDYVGKYKIIGELKVEEEKKNQEDQKSSLTTESFTVYVSGIDTRTGIMLDKSLSDVNMIITVNPKTKNILMTTIPRDYYVQLHGTSGLRDKLTHAGALGGLELSMSTIEDLLDFNFSRYIRVNFNFVVNLVNAVGGITLYSDVNYNVTAYTDHSCTFYPGNNVVDGRCALAFARERYAYADGDRHRGRNQEQVIEKVFEKLTSSSTFISRYSDILNSLNGSFDTNIAASDITSLANMQLDDMAKWTVETYNLDGSTGMTYTYSYPNQLLSVMYPDETTVEAAKIKIKQVLAGTTEAAPTETTETVTQE